MNIKSNALPPKIGARELGTTDVRIPSLWSKTHRRKTDRLIAFQELTDLNFDKTCTLSLGCLHYGKNFFTKGLKLLYFKWVENYFSKLVENSFKWGLVRQRLVRDCTRWRWVDRFLLKRKRTCSSSDNQSCSVTTVVLSRVFGAVPVSGMLLESELLFGFYAGMFMKLVLLYVPGPQHLCSLLPIFIS